MEFKWKEKVCLIEMDTNEQILVMSKKDKAYFLQVVVDEYDDLIFTRRTNLKK